ncbi:MAG: FkbM family methyltransferase [Arenicella sp.]|nr:FkbM family methyltransferase [Arenicella sp.]
MIPKIIHQTWKTDQVPSEWTAFAQSWRRHHPNWKYKLWSNADGAEFVEQFYPHFSRTYFAYSRDIQRADAIRYLLIYHYGGLYVDLDFECLQSLDSLLDSDKLVIGLEPREHARDQALDQLLCNALFASQPGSAFLKAVIDFLITDDTHAGIHDDVLNTTGPVMLQKVYEQVKRQGVSVYPSSYFCPFVNNAPELSQLAENSYVSDTVRRKLVSQGCFAVHHWANSWITDSAVDLLNPRPNSIAGFDFYPMHDSPGMDLYNGGRDIEALAEQCRADPLVVAFNTDGFAKHMICPTTNLIAMQSANSDEGLYVKKATPNNKQVLGYGEHRQLVYIASAGLKPFSLLVYDADDEVISWSIKNNQIWEPVETALVSKLISVGDNVVDIGANIGYFTVLFAQLVGEQGKVYGFEPEAQNYSLLEANILVNHLDNVIIENHALSDRSSVADLHLSSCNKGDHRLGYSAGREKQKVSIIVLDQYLSNVTEQIHFIKSDTQGHELKVLKGMTKVIERNRDHLCCLVEFCPGLLSAAEPNGLEMFIEFFDWSEAEVYWIHERGQNPELVLMDKTALHQLGCTMMEHEKQDHSCNIIIFFSTKARIKYFGKMGW